MIVNEPYGVLPDGTKLQRTYSDRKKYIHKIGTAEIYAEAVDFVPICFAYEETDMDIETDSESAEDNEVAENVAQPMPLNRGNEES